MLFMLQEEKIYQRRSLELFKISSRRRTLFFQPAPNGSSPSFLSTIKKWILFSSTQVPLFQICAIFWRRRGHKRMQRKPVSVVINLIKFTELHGVLTRRIPSHSLPIEILKKGALRRIARVRINGNAPSWSELANDLDIFRLQKFH